MIKKILGWSVLVLLVAYVVCAAIWAHAEAAKNTCKGIDIEIVKGHLIDSVTHKGVLAEISRYPHKILGAQIPTVDTRELEKYLKGFPQFEDVTCSFNTAGRLKVKVQPMVPEIRVFEDSGSYYVNKDGKRMASKASFFVDVPVVSGRFNERFKATDVLPVTRFIANDEMLSQLVGMVRAEDSENIILVPRIHGHVINFGDTTHLPEKKEALLAIYRKVLPYKGWEEYDTISVKFKGQVVASRRNKGARHQPVIADDDIDMEEATLPEIETASINTETGN